jgi:predicted dehydrogenase
MPASASSTRLDCCANDRETAMSDAPVRVGVVGLGYWGPNLARNFGAIPGCELAYVCDADEAVRGRVARMFPQATPTAELDDLLADPELDAIVLATPVPTHAELAVRVLEAGKHCFVEKPLAQSAAAAQRAVAAAQRSGRILMVGHLLEYHPGVRKLKELTESGELGDEIYYIYGNRLNLGKLRADENALWSLGAHDVSVVLYLAGEEPDEVVAHGESYVRDGVEDVVFCFCASPRVWSPTCTSPGSIPTRSGGSRWSAPRRWPPSTTWRSSAS